MTHVLVRANRVVKTIDALRPLTTAEKRNSGARYPVQAGLIVYIGGRATVTNNVVTAITNPDAKTTAEQRREIVKNYLRFQEKAPMANWAIRGSSESTRAKITWEWLEMIACASSFDANLTNATRWGLIEIEMSNTVEDFYTTHNPSDNGWGTVVQGGLARAWYSLGANGSAVVNSSMQMATNRNPWGGLASYLHG